MKSEMEAFEEAFLIGEWPPPGSNVAVSELLTSSTGKQHKQGKKQKETAGKGNESPPSNCEQHKKRTEMKEGCSKDSNCYH